jgi:hypothetical protein
MTEHTPDDGDEVEPVDIPTDPQIQSEEHTGKTGESGAPETPGGSSTPQAEDEGDA